MNSRFPHLASHLFNVPLLLHPTKAEVLIASLTDRLGITSIARGRPHVDWDDEGPFDNEGGFGGPGPSGYVGYDVSQGVAKITISGTLVHNFGLLRPYSGMTGYDGIKQNVLTAMADPKVRAIMFDIDSPGGEASGCFDLVDCLYRCRGIKPMWAIVDEMACSGAMAIASAADRVITPRTGVVGSVGVIVVHVDMSDAVAASGLKVTILTHGDHKADGNPYERLPRAVQSRMQADIDTIGALFVDTIARNMGIDASSVQSQEAACFLGAAGVAAGLAHDVMSPDQAFAEFVASL